MMKQELVISKLLKCRELGVSCLLPRDYAG